MIKLLTIVSTLSIITLTIALPTISLPLKQFSDDLSPIIPELDNIFELKKFFETRYIPSEGMLPTLQVNDKVLIDKRTYLTQSPKRGDIVIFLPTEKLQEQNFNYVFIKRVIGLPGEVIEIKNGKVYINSQPLLENYIAEPPNYTFNSVTIPSNAYFGLGDNRNNSYDSHYWGFVPKANILGKAIAIYCPIERQQVFDHEKPLNSLNKQVLSFIYELVRQDPSFCKI